MESGREAKGNPLRVDDQEKRSSGAPTFIVKHSIVIAGHRTSISLEDAFWTALKGIAVARELSVAALVAEIDESRGEANLSSAIRVAVLAAVSDNARLEDRVEPV